MGIASREANLCQVLLDTFALAKKKCLLWKPVDHRSMYFYVSGLTKSHLHTIGISVSK